MGLVLVLLACWLVGATGEALQERGVSTRPYLFFYDQPNDDCPGTSTCRGVLANYNNYVSSVTLFVTVDTSQGGGLVNFPASTVSNDRRGSCDTYIQAGNLGFEGVRFNPSSSDWTAAGNAGMAFSFVNQSDPGQASVWSCGLGPLALDSQPDCPGGDFYQLLAQLAYRSATISVEWVLTLQDLTINRGVSTCTQSPEEQPSFQVTTFGPTTPAPDTTTVPCDRSPDIVPDGQVNVLDVAALLDGQDQPQPAARFDLNCDDLYNTADVQEVLSAWSREM